MSPARGVTMKAAGALVAACLPLAGTLLAGAAFGAQRATPEVNISFDDGAVQGILGKGMRFSGSQDAGIRPAPEGFAAPATVSVWIKVGCPRIDYRLISGEGGETDRVGSIRFQGCHVHVWNGSAWQEVAPFIAVNGSWQHLAIVFGADGTATGYVNGKKARTVPCGFDFTGAKLGIGSGVKATGGKPFAGDLDELRIYHRALSDAEVADLYPARLFAAARREDGTALTPLGKRARQESIEPVRPGVAGRAPFWNTHARRFIYAPAFDFAVVPTAQRYRFTATCGADGSVVSFEAPNPDADLSPIWLAVKDGPVSLKVEGIGGADGSVVGTAGTRDFIKSPAFNGPYKERVCSYRECGLTSLEARFNHPFSQNALKAGQPDYNFVFPCKFMGAMATGMSFYAQAAPKSSNAADAMKLARICADYLIELTEKPGTPLAGWPPTYWNGWPPSDPKYTHQPMMTLYPAEAAMGYLDLYDATHDAKYMNAARTIADTYMRLRLKCGTWYQILDSVTGRPTAPNLLVPTFIISFFDRLRDQYGIGNYEEARQRAFDWIMANPMRTYNWQGQFEDVGAKEPYVDQSNLDVTAFSIILFQDSARHPEYLEQAKELLRFGEDQFCVWDRRDTVSVPNWAIPGALEQYVCYTSINGSNHCFIRAYIAAYKATGDPMYKEKALALADTMTVAWKDFGSKEIPTWMSYGEPSNDWMNCTVASSITLLECEKLLKQ